ncbi:hypothetical protein [Sphingobacterium tabacisoli]|uniref:Uncharacterized protein n=1 Tax=Sphingobacterium tabacisoli TaxID=2044855 RepID=A0ABW5L420_9SPHI|nr:hypothetical protein [Sphingobacterium tabacisoli]
MNKKLFSLLMTTVLFLTAHGQGKVPSDQIRTFYSKLYNLTINPADIVKEYIIYSDSIGYNSAVATIESFRNPVNGEGEHFMLLKHDIQHNDYILSAYESFVDQEKMKFQYLDNIQHLQLYKISPKHTINQYILMKDNKIHSFAGFQKRGSDTYTFIVYE